MSVLPDVVGPRKSPCNRVGDSHSHYYDPILWCPTIVGRRKHKSEREEKREEEERRGRGRDRDVERDKKRNRDRDAETEKERD